MATIFNNDTIFIDPKDYKGIIKLMDRADEFDSALIGKNKDDERVLLSINNDNVTTQTFQSNNWCRENIYWRNGCTEELYYK